jgi:hypothetical protein
VRNCELQNGCAPRSARQGHDQTASFGTAAAAHALNLEALIQLSWGTLWPASAFVIVTSFFGRSTT